MYNSIITYKQANKINTDTYHLDVYFWYIVLDWAGFGQLSDAY